MVPNGEGARLFEEEDCLAVSRSILDDHTREVGGGNGHLVGVGHSHHCVFYTNRAAPYPLIENNLAYNDYDKVEEVQDGLTLVRDKTGLLSNTTLQKRHMFLCVCVCVR